MTSKIEWTNETWNPIVGCSKVSPGCENCYAIREAHRMAGNPNHKISGIYAGLTTEKGNNWTRQVKFVEGRLDHHFYVWKRPRMVFVNSMSDLFHEDVPFAVIEKIFETMMKAKQHTFQVLTKRPRRMYEFWLWCKDNHLRLADRWPLPNVWLGVSVENQEYADERIPWLLKVPAAIRFLSCEPLLGPLDVSPYLPEGYSGAARFDAPYGDTPPIDWVIVGGESGPGARPMHPDWARSIRDQCQEANVPYFFKQWGEWLPWIPREGNQNNHSIEHVMANGGKYYSGNFTSSLQTMIKVGKKRAGRLLDGREHNAFPEVQHA